MAKKVECPPYFSPHRELNFIVQLWQCIQGQSHELRSAQGSEEIAFFFNELPLAFNEKNKKQTKNMIGYIVLF